MNSRHILLAVTYLSGCSSLFAQTGSSAHGSVFGHVFCSDSHTPCRFASVLIESTPAPTSQSSAAASQERHSYTATTDMDGAFTISHVVPGEYYAQARLPGYLSPSDLVTSELTPGARDFAKAVDTALIRCSVDDHQPALLNLSLTRGASISGTVSFGDGAPAIGMEVRLYRRDSAGVWKHYSTTGRGPEEIMSETEHTDDRGRFYRASLAPGAYAIDVGLPQLSVISKSITGSEGEEVTYTEQNALHVYSGDKFTLREARAIKLTEGEQRTDGDVSIPIAGLRTLEGTVSSKSAGQPLSSGAVLLINPEDGQVLRESPIGSDGRFTFHYVRDGSYTLTIDPTKNLQNGEQQVSRFASLSAPLIVEGDASNLAYSLATNQQH